jgi:hypothetical protein
MSQQLTFNKILSIEEIKEKTSLIVEERDGCNWLVDKFGNVIQVGGNDLLSMYGITIRGLRNPTFILDELIKTFNIMFIDDEAEELLYYEPEKYKVNDMFIDVMGKYGYIIDGELIIPQREEDELKPISQEKLNKIDEEIKKIFKL